MAYCTFQQTYYRKRGGPSILNLFIPLVAKVGLAWVTEVAIVVVTKRWGEGEGPGVETRATTWLPTTRSLNRKEAYIKQNSDSCGLYVALILPKPQKSNYLLKGKFDRVWKNYTQLFLYLNLRHHKSRNTIPLWYAAIW